MSDSETTQPADESPLGPVKGLVEEHPVAMLAGGILLGALVAGVLSRPHKPATNAKPAPKPKRSLGRRAVQIATLGAEIAAAYAASAESMAEDAAETAKEHVKSTVKATAAAAPAAVKSARARVTTLAGAALRTLGPVIRRRLGRKPAD